MDGEVLPDRLDVLQNCTHSAFVLCDVERDYTYRKPASQLRNVSVVGKDASCKLIYETW
jgi:hypothetical protein